MTSDDKALFDASNQCKEITTLLSTLGARSVFSDPELQMKIQAAVGAALHSAVTSLGYVGSTNFANVSEAAPRPPYTMVIGGNIKLTLEVIPSSAPTPLCPEDFSRTSQLLPELNDITPEEEKAMGQLLHAAFVAGVSSVLISRSSSDPIPETNL